MSYGPMANDPLDDERCNAKIHQVGNSNRVILVPTCDIKSGDEIFVSYGKEYWSDQPHCDLDVLQAAQSYYADASDTVNEVITPFTIASKLKNITPLSATANEWYPDTPQSAISDDDVQSIDSQELLSELASSESGFVQYNYPILQKEARITSDIWGIHNAQAHKEFSIKSIIRPEAIDPDNLSRIDIQVATWNINGGLNKHKQKLTDICWLFSAL